MQPKMSLNVKLKSVKTNNKKPSNKALVIQFLRIIKVGQKVNLFSSGLYNTYTSYNTYNSYPR